VIYCLSNRGNSDYLESPWRSFAVLQGFQMWFFIQLCSRWQDSYWYSESRCP